MFLVGDGTDEYRFEISGAPPGCDVSLATVYSDDSTLVPGQWYDGALVCAVQLLITDRAGTAAGQHLAVHVEQLSSGRIVPVEFDFAA
jgi:hypothetical protein